jgi:hypothetical protein
MRGAHVRSSPYRYDDAAIAALVRKITLRPAASVNAVDTDAMPISVETWRP